MKKTFLVALSIMVLLTLTGCKAKKTETSKGTNDSTSKTTYPADATVVKNQIFEGLEFINIGLDTKDNKTVIKTSIINNTGVPLEKTNFNIKCKDKSGKVIEEVKGEVPKEVKNGDTLVVETVANKEIKNVYSVEYSIN